MREILDWPISNEWIFNAIWIAGACCAGVGVFRAWNACNRARTIAWGVGTLCVLVVTVVAGLTDAIDWEDFFYEHLQQVDDRSSAPVINARSAPGRFARAPAETLADIERAMSKQDSWKSDHHLELAKVLPSILESELDAVAIFKRMRELRATAGPPSREEVALWMEFARKRLAQVQPTPASDPRFYVPTLMGWGDRAELQVMVNYSTLLVPPTLWAGVVARAVHWRVPGGEWHPWKSWTQLPAKVSGFQPIVLDPPPTVSFEYKVSGVLVVFGEDYPEFFELQEFEIVQPGIVEAHGL